MNWLENGELMSAIGDFLAEDIGRGDITTRATVASDTRGLGRFLAKEDLVICGLDVAEAVFFHLDPDSSEVETSYAEGDEVQSGTVFATLKGYADVLLTGERVERFASDLTAVNVHSEDLGRRLSGIFRELGLVTRDEWEELALRVAQLEHRVRLLEPDDDTPPGR